MWYKNVYRRHLCDMHIDDWNSEFLSGFSPEKYFENLKKAKIQNAMLYFQSHVGLCYYPTASGKMHAGFAGKEDSVKKLCLMCRESGIHVTGYYSLVYNNWAHDSHPEWRMVTQSGRSLLDEEEQTELECATGKRVHRYGLCCPNNMEYRKFTAMQIKEMCEYFTFDGMFFDMLFWPHICFCESCKARWEREVGGELPDSGDWNDERWLLHIKKRREWMGEFAQFAADEVRKYVPGASVEHNVAFAGLSDATKALAEEVLSATDYAGGDLYGGIYAQSFVCKLYKNVTGNQPFEYMFSRCTPSLSYHTVTKSEDEMSSAASLTAAHHGATLVIDAIDPVGTMDGRVYDRIGRVFGKLIPYEKYYNGKMLEELGFYYSLKSKFNPQGESFTNHNSCVNSVKTMIYDNILCGVTGSFHQLESYKLLAAPYLTDVDGEDYGRITDYVRNGGSLYLSGGNCKGLLREFFGAGVTGTTEETVVYLAPAKEYEHCFDCFNSDYPMHFDASAPIVEFSGNCRVIASVTLPYTRQDTTKFASIHSNPPGIKTGIPAMLYTEYGKGRVLWSALPVEAEDSYVYRRVFVNLLTEILGFERDVSCDAPKDVEITVFEDDNSLLVNAVLLCEDYKARRPENFSVSIKTGKKPVRVELVNKNRCVDYVYDKGTVTFRCENLEIFDMYKIEF